MATQTKTRPKPKNKKSNTKPITNPIIWVEIPVTDMERAKTFYTKVFGLSYEMIEMHGYKLALISMNVNKVGVGGALVYGESYNPSYEGPVVYFTTKNIEASLQKAVDNGGKIIQPKKSIGQYGQIAYFEDTEGNRIALHSM